LLQARRFRRSAQAIFRLACLAKTIYIHCMISTQANAFHPLAGALPAGLLLRRAR
jgi:hypothetical protein